MAYVESDETYCSEAEKESPVQMRRSERLSQKPRLCFRPPLVSRPSQRFTDIYDMLQEGFLCSRWSTHDWEALRLEVGALKKSIKRVAKSKIQFVDEKIRRRIEELNPTFNLCLRQQSKASYQKENTETGNSPNILAERMTETSSELPPHQSVHHLNQIQMQTEHVPMANTLLTQVAALDLTKRTVQKPGIIQRDTPSKPLDHKKSMKNFLTTSKPNVSTVDMTKTKVTARRKKVSSSVKNLNLRHPSTSNPPIVRWVPFVQPPDNLPKEIEIVAPEPSKPLQVLSNKNPSSFKKSVTELYKENVSLLANESITSPERVKKKTLRLKDKPRQMPLRKTETFCTTTLEPNDPPPPRNAHSEYITNCSPESFADDLISLELSSFDGNNSVASFTSSLKMGFKKIYGTDCLNDVLGCEKIAYSLTEGHVQRLAKVLNMQYDLLKKAIEQILNDDQDVVVVEDDGNSNSSVVECSQSPPIRMFPSQRSQTNK